MLTSDVSSWNIGGKNIDKLTSAVLLEFHWDVSLTIYTFTRRFFFKLVVYILCIKITSFTSPKIGCSCCTWISADLHWRLHWQLSCEPVNFHYQACSSSYILASPLQLSVVRQKPGNYVTKVNGKWPENTEHVYQIQNSKK